MPQGSLCWKNTPRAGGRVSPGSFATRCPSPDGADTRSAGARTILWLQTGQGWARAELGRPVGAGWTLHPGRLPSLPPSFNAFILFWVTHSGCPTIWSHHMPPLCLPPVPVFLLDHTGRELECQGHSGSPETHWICTQTPSRRLLRPHHLWAYFKPVDWRGHHWYRGS